jgi:outer membrane protein
MRRNYLLAAAVAAVLLAGPLCGIAAEQKFAFVDMERLFNEFYKTKLADAKLKDRADEFNDERKALVDEMKKLEEAFNAARDEAQNTALSDDAREEKRNAAEEKLVEIRENEGKLRRFDESRRKQLDDQSRRMRKDIVVEIRAAVETYSRTQGLSAVIDSSGQSLNGVEMLLYVDTKVDVTDAVVEILNRGQQQPEEETPETEK